MQENQIIAEDLQELYDHAPCGYISFLLDGTIVNINQTLLTWIGYTRDEVVHKIKFHQLISVGERIFYETHFAPLLQMQKTVEEVNFTIISRNRKRIPTLTSTHQRATSDGFSTVNRMTIFNMSERKKFEEELVRERVRAEAALRAKSDFLSMLSHEIRTPLTAVVGIAHMLESTKLSAEQKELSEMLKSSSENLMNLLNSILDLSKIESGIVALEKRDFDCRQLVSDIVHSWQGRSREKGILVEVVFSDKLPAVLRGDSIKVGQIVNNLVGNAIKFTDKGFVRVSVLVSEISPTDCSVIFEVEDSGVGISPDQLNHIFDEFKQAEYNTGVQYGGSGLGLTICKKLAEMHGTSIQVESTVGKGSTFSFDVKFDIPSEVLKPASASSERNPEAIKGLYILIADDSADNLFLVRHYLKKWGVRSETASDGREAVEKVLAHDFDLIFLDLHMPVMDGYEATLAIRALSNQMKAHTPIVAFSASTTFGGQDIVETMPVNALMGKPFRPNDLFDNIFKHARSVHPKQL